MPGKHDQHKHGHQHSMDRAEGDDLIGDTSGAGPALSAHEHAVATSLHSSTHLGPNGDQLAHGIAQQQGFAGRPATVSKSEMDDLVAEGHTEMFRGIHDSPSGSPAELSERIRSGESYHGPGRQGAGIHSSSSRDIAETYTHANDGTTATSGEVTRMALHKDAKVVDHHQLVDEHREFMSEVTPGGASESVYSDVGRYATARGYDASRDVSHSGDAKDAWDFTVYNRTALYVEDGASE